MLCYSCVRLKAQCWKLVVPQNSMAKEVAAVGFCDAFARKPKHQQTLTGCQLLGSAETPLSNL